jgi:hypothetical protein
MRVAEEKAVPGARETRCNTNPEHKNTSRCFAAAFLLHEYCYVSILHAMPYSHKTCFMKLIMTLLVFVLLLVSCSSPKKTAAKTTHSFHQGPDHYSNEGFDYATAIFIDKKNESEGVPAVYKWLSEHYPGYILIKQTAQHKENKSYDIMHIKTKEGQERYVYFDISRFFGKP